VIGPLPDDWFDMLKNELVQNLRLKRAGIVRRT
jgi:hypothetical protein